MAGKKGNKDYPLETKLEEIWLREDKPLFIFTSLTGIETALPIIEKMIIELKLTSSSLSIGRTIASALLSMKEEFS